MSQFFIYFGFGFLIGIPIWIIISLILERWGLW